MKVYDYYITPAEYELAAQNGVSRELVNHRSARSDGTRIERSSPRRGRRPSIVYGWRLLQRTGYLKGCISKEFTVAGQSKT